MKIKNEPNRNLKILWEMRDLAEDDKARKKAQEKVDEYFLGKPEKGGKKRKEKKKKFRTSEDDWGY